MTRGFENPPSGSSARCADGSRPQVVGAAWFSGIGARSTNEDTCAFWWAGETFFAAVADGLGGLPGGGQASRYAVRFLREHAARANVDTRELAGLVLEAHCGIRRLQEHDPARDSMATTLTVGCMRDGELALAHCGDTRLYVTGCNGVRQLTEDHSEAQRLFNEGTLTSDAFANYPRKHILESALGIPGQPVVQAWTGALMAGDWLVIASDGAYHRFEPVDLLEIGDASRTAAQFARACRKLVEARGPRDNYTAIVARIGRTPRLPAGLGRLFAPHRAGGNLDVP